MSDAQSPEPAQHPTFDALPLSADVRRAIDALGYDAPDAGAARRLRARDAAARTSSSRRAPAPARRPRSASHRRLARQRSVAEGAGARASRPTRELALQVAREIEQLAQVPRHEDRPRSTAARRWAGRSTQLARGRAGRRRHAGPRARSPPPRHARPVEHPHLRPRRGRRDALDGLRARSSTRSSSTLPKERQGALLQRDDPAGHRAHRAQRS